MQSKNAISIVHAMAGMRGMYKLCIIRNTDVGRALSIVCFSVT